MKYNLPVILLKSLVLLPYQEVRLELNNEISKKTIAVAAKYHDNELLVVCPLDQYEEHPEVNDLPVIGVIGKIKTKIELPNGNLRIVIRGSERVDIIKYVNYSNEIDVLEALYMEIELVKYDPIVETAILRKLFTLLEEYINSDHTVSNSILSSLKGLTDLDKITDIITAFMPFPIIKKLAYMDEVNAIKRAQLLIDDLNIEIEVIKLDEEIESKLKEQFAAQEKEIIIKEKIKILNQELGNSTTKEEKVNDYYCLVDKYKLSNRTKTKLYGEIKKFEATSDSSPEMGVVQNYLEWVLSLPWNKYSTDNKNIEQIKNVLNKNHYGLEQVKSTIIEYIIAKTINPKLNAPIICLVGPPGVGKTSLGMSIAEALNRRFYKISVGGLNDSSELIGHRRTYLGAMPGKIIQGIKKCETSNPVFLIDEVDKMVKDYKGDPASSLLDILDVNNNKYFVDNYIEEPFDLSKVMFILTANSDDDIPLHLKDRLEIIYLNSYPIYDKKNIAKKHLLPQILLDHKVNKQITISEQAIEEIIKNYTFESGLRELNRKLIKIVRKVIVNNYNKIKTFNYNIKVSDIIKYLGAPQFEPSKLLKAKVGSVNAIAYTQIGGLVLTIEGQIIPGEEELILTGSIGKIMNESAIVALDYIKHNYKLFSIDWDKIVSNKIHLHALESSTQKDGSSAGMAIASSIISLYLDKMIINDIAMTGEITLSGQILKVGGIKEKIIGAYNQGIKKVFIPLANKNDLTEISSQITAKIEIVLISDYYDLFKQIFI